MEESELGRSETVNLRTIWPNEALDFTPWLAKNLGLLGDALGMKLKLVQTEAPVGPYSLDILAREADKGVTIAIENQYGPADMTHLGQLLIYAAGCDARIAIWVAPEFGYEHAQALTRLNEWTHDGIEFYGVQVRVIKIGDSLPAPEFRPVVYPGGWNKDITLPSGGMSQIARQFHDFFQPIIGELIRTDFADKAVYHFDHTGRFFPSRLHNGIGYAASLWGERGKNDTWGTFHIQAEDNERTKRIFDALQEQREQIETCIDGDWHWRRHDSFTFSSISLRRDGSIDDPPEKLAATRKWMLEYLPRLKEVMEPRMEAIMAELERESGEA